MKRNKPKQCKAQRVREERYKHKIIPRRVIKEKTEELAKNLSTTLQVEIDPLVNKLEYTNIKKTLQA